MRTILKFLSIILPFIAWAETAEAQVVYPNFTPNPDGASGFPSGPIANPYQYFSIASCSSGGCGVPGAMLNVTDYGNAIYNAANAYTDSKTATLSQQLALVSSSFDSAIRRQNSFLSQGIAMASAIEILPPNPGDRFAVNVGGAGYNGQGAGSVSVTVRVADNVLGYVGYGRSLNQNLVKGGLSISIH